MSRQRAESLLKGEDKEGCFVVRNSSTKGLYTLTLFTKIPHSQVKHYHIKQNPSGYFLSEKHCQPTIAKLIEYHSHNAGGLACRLKNPPGRSKPPLFGSLAPGGPPSTSSWVRISARRRGVAVGPVGTLQPVGGVEPHAAWRTSSSDRLSSSGGL